MDLLDVHITKIHSEEELKRTVRVVMDVNCWGHVEKGITRGFFKYEWPEIKHRMSYLETRPMGEAAIQEFENMSEKEWIRYHYACDIKTFSDEEIVEEFNRRYKSCLHPRVDVKCEAVILPSK